MVNRLSVVHAPPAVIKEVILSETSTQAPSPSETSAYTHGAFVWHELMTSDVDKAKAFYGQLFGWQFQAVDMGDMAYHVIHAGEQGIGGLFSNPAPEAPPAWMGSVSVPDVDAAAARVPEAGGHLLLPPMEAGTFGRYATVMDPRGGILSLFRSHSGDPLEAPMPAQWTFCWDQLNTSDPGAAGGFYAKVIGWNLVSPPNMPGFNVFMMGDAQEASCVPAPPGVPAHWLAHVFVGPLKPSLQKAVELGAKVCVAEIAVPGMGAFSVIEDPTGAMLCLFGQP